MAKNDSKREVSIIWDFLSCALLYGLICYFNGPDKQQELSQEAVQKFAMIASVAWFFMYIIVMAKAGTKVVLFKHKNKKEKIKKAGKKIAKEAGKAVAVKTAIKEAETYILKDPATGAERLFTKDENGQWVSEDGQTVLDMDFVSEWKTQRRKDFNWQNDVNADINKGNSAMDKTIREMDEETARMNAQLDDELNKTLKRIEKYGTTDDDVEHLKEIIKSQQTLDEIEGNRNRRKGNLADIGYKGAKVTKYATDKAFDVIGKTGGAVGKVGKAVYTGLTDQTSAITEAVVEGQDAWMASKKAAIDSTVSIVEDNLGDSGAKFIGNLVGETVRETGKAVVEGKEGMDVFKRGLYGAAKGNFKANTEFLGEVNGEFWGKNGSELLKDVDGNIMGVSVGDKDILDTVTKDGFNAIYDSAAEAVKKTK